jgi:hypothetical protein
MILGKATLAVAAIAVFVRWFGSEHRADQALTPGKAMTDLHGN